MSGQINRGSELGEIIYSYAINNKYNNFLEIGTWNGQGSTKCFIDGLLTRNDYYRFISLEASLSFYNQAVNFHENNLSQNIQILYGKIIDVSDLIYTDISDHRRTWLADDVNNYNKCPNLWGKIPEEYDVVLLDGGEFSTFSEFMKLKDNSKIVILDDTREMKNKDVITYIENDRSWKNIIKSSSRNGFAVYERLYSDQ